MQGNNIAVGALCVGLVGFFSVMTYHELAVQPRPFPSPSVIASTYIEAMKPIPMVSFPKTPVSRRILIVGDSEACAVAPYAKDVAKEHAETNNLPLDVIDMDCKVGTQVSYWAASGNFQAALSRHPKPDTVIVFLGTNHYGNQKDTPNVRPMLALMNVNDINCVWVGNTSVNGKTWNINNLLQIAVTPQCSYFNTETAGIPLADGIHPTQGGAIKWLKAIWPTIPPKYEK